MPTIWNDGSCGDMHRTPIVRPGLDAFLSEQPAHRFAKDRLGIDDYDVHVDEDSSQPRLERGLGLR